MKSSPTVAAEHRRDRVHAAVRELLAEHGFRISMEAVAQRAGCSKQTLYAQFGSKQELLRSFIDSRMQVPAAKLESSTENLAKALLDFADEHLAQLCDPLVVATSQLLSAEARHFPDMAQAIFREAFDGLQSRLAGWIGEAMNKGQLKQDDPHMAAELFLGMIVGLDFDRQRFGVPHRSLQWQRQRWARFAVDSFLRAFSPYAYVPNS